VSKKGAGDWVAIILASGVAISMVVLITGIVWGAIKNGHGAATLTENETQVLLGAFAGIFGILGAYLGFKTGNGSKEPTRFYLKPPGDGEDTAVIPLPEGWPTQEQEGGSSPSSRA